MATAAIALLPTIVPAIVEIVKQMDDIVSKAKDNKLGKDEVQKIQKQLVDMMKSLDDLKGGLQDLGKAGKQILDYRKLYSYSVESDTICNQINDTLDYVGTKGEQPDNVGKILDKLEKNLNQSLENFAACITEKNFKEDFEYLSKMDRDLTSRQGRLERALDKKNYDAAKDALNDMGGYFKSVNETTSDSMYDLIEKFAVPPKKKAP